MVGGGESQVASPAQRANPLRHANFTPASLALGGDRGNQLRSRMGLTSEIIGSHLTVLERKELGPGRSVNTHSQTRQRQGQHRPQGS